MKSIMQWLVALTSIVFGAAGTAHAASSNVIDCKSAHRDLTISYDDYVKAYRETCLPPRTLAEAGVSVWDARKPVAEVSFDGVPTWSDADILNQFAATRDERYMAAIDRPDFPRRISWLYPDDGCFARAEQVIGKVFDAGKAKPYKLWAFGPLRVYTTNHPDGVVGWGWHVVPLVKNSAGEPIVLDAAISPCKPLPWKTWLATMVDDMSVYDDTSVWNGVSVSDYNAYGWTDQDLNEPSGPSHRAQSLSDEQTVFLLDRYMGSPREWGRQIELSRDPNVVLGDHPPWSGNACLFTEVTRKTIDIAANASASAVALCPFGTLSVGGGFLGGGPPSLLISRNARNDNGWEIAVKNTTSSSRSISASAVCLTGAPATASISTVTGNVWLANNGFGSATATCGSGVLVGGGFSTTVGSTASSIVKIYSDGRTTATSNVWRVSASNNTGSGQTVTSYGYCLNNTSFTASQSSGGISAGDGMGVAACEGATLGGGFVYPRTSPYSVWGMDHLGTGYGVYMVPAPPAPDPNTRVYAECLSQQATTCTEATATDMGAEHVPMVVKGNACLKITQYPGSWVGSIIVQPQSGGSGYPIPYTWSNCSSGGGGNITGDWSQITLRPAVNSCTTVIGLTGSASASVPLVWWANG